MIFLSAGHHFNPNKNDPGAVANGVREADLTKELRNLMCAELTNLGARFICDADHETLAQYLSRIKPGSGSVVCELHFNASANVNAVGVEVLVRNNADDSSKQLARKMCEAAAASCGFFNRGMKTEGDSHRGRLGVLNTQAGISVLPEVCFITNKTDLVKFNRYKGDLARRWAKLLKEYDDHFQ